MNRSKRYTILKGSRSKSDNYGPLSLTSVICKLFERLIKDVHPSQHESLKARSCLTNMFLGEITKRVKEGSPVDSIYLDFLESFR